MKKLIVLALALTVGCAAKPAAESVPAAEPPTVVSEPAPAAEEVWDRCPCVQVNGVLYFDTGRRSTLTGRCGLADGTIASACSGSELPTEDDQSSFGTGYDYQYGPESDTIEVQLDDGNWYVFATEARKAAGFP